MLSPFGITVRTKDQRVLVKEHIGYEGGLDNPLSWDSVVEKFHWLSEACADEDLREISAQPRRGSIQTDAQRQSALPCGLEDVSETVPSLNSQKSSQIASRIGRVTASPSYWRVTFDVRR
jgi:hypothetical protein